MKTDITTVLAGITSFAVLYGLLSGTIILIGG